MLFGVPLVIWFGIMTIISVFATFTFGIMMHFFKKPVFRFHKFFAFLTVALAVAHTILAVLFYYYGIVF